jgi:uncharacterized protein involved in exopolysaccharide biosynthesis/Mrp family chromosome partitioning ATPase
MPAHHNPSHSTASVSLSLGDVYYILFRHKWKILVISLIGVLGFFVVPWVMPKSYVSEAELLIRYVTETKTPTGVGGGDNRVQMLDSRADSIINTEMQILTSQDLALQVATNFGAEKILAKVGGGKDPLVAAMVVNQGLLAQLPQKSTVISVSFQHPDAQIVQPILAQIIEAYINRHLAIHQRTGAFDDALTQETDQLRSRVQLTEMELRRAKTNIGILSLEDTRKLYSDQIARARQAIFDVEAELAGAQASADELAKQVGGSALSQTNQTAQTNQAVVKPELVTEYKRICGLLDSLQKREQDLLIQYTAENKLVKTVQQQMAENDKRKAQLELENPGLLSVRVSETKAGDSDILLRTAHNNEVMRSANLRSKLEALNAQLSRLQKDAAALQDVEPSIMELQRKKEMDERHYKVFSEALEQARIEETFGAGRAPNIERVQSPTAPRLVAGQTQKIRLMLLFGCLAGAIGLAFVIELFLDTSLKRPIDIETKIGVPLFLAIPNMPSEVSALALKGAGSRKLLGAPAGEASGTLRPGDGGQELPAPGGAGLGPLPLAPWDSNHAMRPFTETLRDRLIAYFEMKNMTHKPKLVAITGCGGGAGVSTIAAGLAAALSETGDGNVLLVDMNQQHGAAHQFFKGDLACSLDDALEMEKRDQAMVQDNLYVVKNDSPKSERLPSVLPKRFRNLVPRLKASDYDYIIFDMPPVSEISLTPRLSRFMDMVLVVAESEVTDRDVLKRATTLLSQGQPNVGVVLNKRRDYVPKRLQQEL